MDYQERFANALSAKLIECEEYFNQKQIDWKSGAVVFMQNVQKVYNKGSEVEELVNQTKVSTAGSLLLVSNGPTSLNPAVQREIGNFFL